MFSVFRNFSQLQDFQRIFCDFFGILRVLLLGIIFGTSGIFRNFSLFFQDFLGFRVKSLSRFLGICRDFSEFLGLPGNPVFNELYKNKPKDCCYSLNT